MEYGVAEFEGSGTRNERKMESYFFTVLNEKDIITAHWGGASGGIINVGDTVKQTAALKFAKNAMMTVENQMLGFKKYVLLPSYLAVFDTEEFYEEDPYFGKEFN